MSVASGAQIQRLARHRSRRDKGSVETAPITGMGFLAISEAVAGLLGFSATLHVARRLGPEGLATTEHAAAVAAWLLLVVRSGIEQILQREAARRPRLIGRMTDLLITLKCVGAIVGLFLIAMAAILEGGARGLTLAIAGLVLVPSGLSPDLGPRAAGKLGVLAVSQFLKAATLLAWALALVNRRDDLALAALGTTIAEMLAVLLLTGWHVRHFGWPRLRCRWRAALVMTRRGFVASLIRFLRVGVYGADLLAIGWLSVPGGGSYAAARRLAFAVIAVGLVVPAGFGPTIARGWAAGREPARQAVHHAYRLLLTLSLPAALGLTLTADRLLPALFGPDYQPGFWSVLFLGARIPALMVSSLNTVALLACRREAAALRITMAMGAATLVGIPACTGAWGLPGISAAMFGVEVLGAVMGWFSLRSLGIAPIRIRDLLPILAGCAILSISCQSAGSLPVGAVVLVGVVSYGVTLVCWRFLARAWLRSHGLGGVS